MGHRAGWLALGAGIAGGADVILIPEIPTTSRSVAEAIRARSPAASLQHRRGRRGEYGVMVAARGQGTEPVALEDVAGRGNLVPPDHPWVETARHVGTNLGDA
jgi:6-phosphofructokinase